MKLERSKGKQILGDVMMTEFENPSQDGGSAEDRWRRMQSPDSHREDVSRRVRILETDWEEWP